MELKDPSRYWRLVEKLNYLTITRPNISYIMSVANQFLETPKIPHWYGLIHFVQYLMWTPLALDCYIGKMDTWAKVLSDADWTRSHSYRRSTNRSYTFVGGNLVTWKSKKQIIVAHSSTKVEYNAMTHTTSELMWLQHFIWEIEFPAPAPLQLFSDDQVVIHIASNPMFHERTKYIKIDCHFIRNKIFMWHFYTFYEIC